MAPGDAWRLGFALKPPLYFLEASVRESMVEAEIIYYLPLALPIEAGLVVLTAFARALGANVNQGFQTSAEVR